MARTLNIYLRPLSQTHNEKFEVIRRKHKMKGKENSHMNEAAAETWKPYRTAEPTHEPHHPKHGEQTEVQLLHLYHVSLFLKRLLDLGKEARIPLQVA